MVCVCVCVCVHICMCVVFQLVMQDLEDGKRRKKKSVLSKIAGGSNQSSPRGLADSLDSVGNDRTSRSDDYGLEGSRGSEKPRTDPVSQDHSLLDAAESGFGELVSDDAEDDGRGWQNFAGAEKNGLDDSDDVDYNDGDDVDAGLDDKLKKNDPPSSSEYFSPRQSPSELRQQLVNGSHVISDPEDDDEVSDYEEAGALAAVARDNQKSLPVLNGQQLTREDDLSKSNPPQAEVASSSTFGSSMMKFFGFNTRAQAPLESSVVAGSVSSLSSTMSKMSTKDARNRFVPF